MTVKIARKRGPKKKKGVRRRYDIRLYLWEGEDDDLIAFLEDLPGRQRPAGLKLALRSGGALSDLQFTAFEDEEDEIDYDMDDYLS